MEEVTSRNREISSVFCLSSRLVDSINLLIDGGM